MPISPKHEWQETATTLEVRVDIKGLSRSKAEVFATDALLKVNYPPYLLLLDLAHDVDDTQSAATLSADGVTFKLVKVRSNRATIRASTEPRGVDLKALVPRLISSVPVHAVHAWGAA